MIRRTEIILAHMWHSAKESSMMIILIMAALSVLSFLAVSRIGQRISWGLTSDSTESEGLDDY